MFRNFLRNGIIVILIISSLAGCTKSWGGDKGPASTAVVDIPTGTSTLKPVPTNTPLPTATATLMPTETSTSTPTPTPTQTPTPMPYGPSGFPEEVNPLTGLFVEDPALLNRLPVMVKVSNFPRGLRPHSGLSGADLVFEYTIGAGATRFTAIYYGQDLPKVGPVRSARLIDASLGTAYQGVLAFASADAYVYGKVVTALGNRAITEGPLTCPGLCRTGNGDVNSVFVNTEQFMDYAVEERSVPRTRTSLDGMLFDFLPPEGGENGSFLHVQYSYFARSEWRYDDTSHTYLRWIEDVDAANNVTMIPLTDRETGEQLSFSNVIVLFAQHNELKPTLHEIILLGNYSGQPALLFRNGQVYEILWKYVNANMPLQFTTLEGETIAFRPGNSWFEVVGLNSGVQERSPGEYQVNLYLP